MDGMGIVKGLGVTLKRFADTYLDDLVWLFKREKRYYSEAQKSFVSYLF